MMSGSVDRIDYGVRSTPWESLDYGSQFSQYARFAVVKDLGIREGDSVFDIGSGLGELKRFFDLLNIDIRYSGCEPVKELFDNNYSHNLLNMTWEDAFQKNRNPENNSFDWYVCCGVYAESRYSIQDVLSTISQVYQLAAKGFVFTFLSEDHQEKKIYQKYFSPIEMFDRTRDLIIEIGDINPRLVLRYDYMPHSFAIYAYKGESAWVKRYKKGLSGIDHTE